MCYSPFISGPQHPVWCTAGWSKASGRNEDEAEGFSITTVTPQLWPPIQAFWKDDFQLAVSPWIPTPLAHWCRAAFNSSVTLSLSLPGFTPQKSPAAWPACLKAVVPGPLIFSTATGGSLCSGFGQMRKHVENFKVTEQVLIPAPHPPTPYFEFLNP